LGTSAGASVAKSIMIVDDNETVRGILRDLFVNNPEWHVCAEASNGEEAVEKAREFSPEFVLLDFSMPSMNGLEAARRLKTILPKTVIVMMTAFKDGFLEEEAYEAGVSWVLSKSAEDVRKVLDFAGVMLSLDAPPNASRSGPRGVRKLKPA
jgi:DNA-binding NarL/FixJ family response regulator